ncbi:hypothetical protein EVAR_28335_1 [Eumeta japonica]|uniref:Uncharacterized protein n=1 Tax=Eumeta variegata TaxID=151549 RepID=A0A4C1V939_EUMVA|nr:hypothetical protein EVAR_28335_1 [Eumeta japonica]
MGVSINLRLGDGGGQARRRRSGPGVHGTRGDCLHRARGGGYTAPVAYSAYSAPLAYSAYTYASPYAGYYLR